MSGDFEVLGTAAGAGCIASVGRILVYVADRPPETAHLRSFASYAKQHVRTHGTGVGYMLIAGDSSVPGAEIRGEIARLFTSLLADGDGFAIVLEAQGFVGSIQRSVATGLSLMTGYRDKMRIFASPVDAAAWLASATGAGGSAAEWATSVRALQDSLRDETDERQAG